MPSNLSCCEGIYSAEFEIENSPILKDLIHSSDLAIFIPGAGGLQEIYINHKKADLIPTNTYRNIGPLVPIANLVEPHVNKIRIDIHIRDSNLFSTGLYRGAPVIGKLRDVDEYKGRRTTYLQTLPLIFSVIYLSLSGIFFWLSSRLGKKDNLFFEYALMLLAGGIFDSFLSGYPRIIYPELADRIHFPIRLCATWGIINLAGNALQIPKSTAKALNLLCLLLVLLSLGSGFLDSKYGQNLAHFISIMVLMYPIGYAIKNRRNDPLFGITLFILPFNISDAFKLMAESTNINYPIPYANRQIMPIMILTGIVYLIQQLLKEMSNAARNQAIEELASQVAHDIRSPLAALEMCSEFLDSIPEDHRLIIRSATQRIKDIANMMLLKGDAQKNLPTSKRNAGIALREATSVQFLPALIERIVAEKRVQYRLKGRVEIEFHCPTNTYGIFSRVVARDFKRGISNLLDNAVEAVGNSGRVQVILSQKNQNVILQVMDNGKGINKSILSLLGEKGATFGKANGSGLGLHYAKRTVQGWGGDLQIESEEHQWTRVTLRLPIAESPGWFTSEIRIIPGTKIVILDDDVSIHHVWEKRIQTNNRSGEEGTICHLYSGQELKQWLESNGDSEALFLIDYELLGDAQNGLDLIQCHDLSKNSILVTSHFEDQDILQRCNSLKVRLIPKGMISLVPIVYDTKKKKVDLT